MLRPDHICISRQGGRCEYCFSAVRNVFSFPSGKPQPPAVPQGPDISNEELNARWAALEQLDARWVALVSQDVTSRGGLR